METTIKVWRKRGWHREVANGRKKKGVEVGEGKGIYTGFTIWIGGGSTMDGFQGCSEGRGGGAKGGEGRMRGTVSGGNADDCPVGGAWGRAGGEPL